MGRSPKTPPRDKWFEQWFRAMPESWQAGLHAAIAGDVFIGELLKRQDHADVIVMFLPPHIAARVEAFLWWQDQTPAPEGDNPTQPT